MKNSTFEKIPKTIIQYIFSFLNVKEIGNAMLTNKFLLDVIQNSNLIWKKKLLELRIEREKDFEDLNEFFSDFEKNEFEQNSSVYFLHYKYKLFNVYARIQWRAFFKQTKKKFLIKKEIKFTSINEQIKRVVFGEMDDDIEISKKKVFYFIFYFFFQFILFQEKKNISLMKNSNTFF
jgi:hypothetical protein